MLKVKKKIKYLSVIALVSVFSCISDNTSNIPKPSSSTIVESSTPSPVVSYLPSPSSTPYVEEIKYRGDINYYAETNGRPQFSPDGKKIAFVRGASTLIDYGGNIGGATQSGGYIRLSVINTDGSNLYNDEDTRYDLRDSFGILWFPNKDKLFFRVDNYNIRLLDLESKKLLDIADNKIYYHPTFSFDGKKVSYVSETSNLSILNLEDKSIKDLNIKANTPIISPDGNKVVFVSNIENKTTSLYLINSDGTGLKKIDELDLEYYPYVSYISWSPDSKKIAYKCIVNSRGFDEEYLNKTENFEIMIFNLDNDKKSTFSSGISSSRTSFSWSPDSKKIVFPYLKKDLSELFIKDIDGSNLIQLTDSKMYSGSVLKIVSNSNPSWSPDGKKIAFDSNREGFLHNYNRLEKNGLSDIYIIDSDGRNLKRLTTAKYSVTEK